MILSFFIRTLQDVSYINTNEVEGGTMRTQSSGVERSRFVRWTQGRAFTTRVISGGGIYKADCLITWTPIPSQ